MHGIEALNSSNNDERSITILYIVLQEAIYCKKEANHLRRWKTMLEKSFANSDGQLIIIHEDIEVYILYYKSPLCNNIS